MFEPLVHVHKTVLMQRLMDAVIHGYVWYTSGTVPLARAQRLADKFAHHYAVDRNANQRAYAKRQKRANARLFLWGPEEGSDTLQWWLVATQGTGAIHKLEKLHDARDKRTRLRMGNDYELLRTTRTAEHGGGTVWTWRMTRTLRITWRERLLAACRRTEAHEINRAVSSLYRAPGFSAIRQQVGMLAARSPRRVATSAWGSGGVALATQVAICGTVGRRRGAAPHPVRLSDHTTHRLNQIRGKARTRVPWSFPDAHRMTLASTLLLC